MPPRLVLERLPRTRGASSEAKFFAATVPVTRTVRRTSPTTTDTTGTVIAGPPPPVFAAACVFK
jgi:hypothetical protein